MKDAATIIRELAKTLREVDYLEGGALDREILRWADEWLAANAEGRPEVERERRTLQWIEGPQAFHDSPDSRDLGAVRDSGLARDQGGRIVLTDAGRSRLEELEHARTERGHAP